MRNIDKFRGCLIGGAAGDALGYAVEFKREDEIFSEYGKDGITEYDLILDDDVAEISDDTQMTLFTAEGMLRAFIQNTNVIDAVRKAYQNWYRTQTETFPLSDCAPDSCLLQIPELFSRRAPGMTCMDAIKSGAKGSVDNPINDSKGCGGVMRAAPVGLYYSDTPVRYEWSDMIGAKAAALTHGHDLGYIPAAALAHIVRAVTESDIPLKDAVNDSVRTVRKIFPKAAHLSEFTGLMQKAVRLAETETDDFSAIHQLGEGWVAEETLAISVYCALKYENDFDKALRAAVNHNGDSDSTGAVCGNILGAYLGYHAIPQKYKECLELHDQIMDTADQLCNEFVDVLYSKHGNVTLPGIIQVFTIMYLEQLRNPNTNEIKGSAVIDGYPVQITYTKTGEQYQVRVACEGKDAFEFTNTLFPEDVNEEDGDTFDVACAIRNIAKKT